MVRRGGIVESKDPILIHDTFDIPKELYDKSREEMRSSKDPLSNWVLGSPYALPDNAPEEVKEWARRVREGLLNFQICSEK